MWYMIRFLKEAESARVIRGGERPSGLVVRNGCMGELELDLAEFQ